MKNKLLYASPFLPMKSGISDYSEILVYGLKEYFDITLLIDNYKLQNKNLYKDFEVQEYNHNVDFSKFDYKIYNIGNNPYFHSYIYEAALKYPGTIILHDYSLYYLFIGYYEKRESLYSKIFECGGAKGIGIIKNKIKNSRPGSLLEIKDIAHILPLNYEILSQANGVIVHSQYTKNLILSQHPNISVHKINMVYMSNQQNIIDYRKYLKEKYGISENSFVIASFGNIASTKQNHLVCEAVKRLADQGFDVFYIMVGEGDYINNLLGDRIIKTGFVEREVYDAILDRCDIVANLRYPSMGETSISLIHAMGMGKACMVTDDAWFSELPDDVVIKLKKDCSSDILYNSILSDYNNKERVLDLCIKAKQFVRSYHSIESISEDINAYLCQS